MRVDVHAHHVPSRYLNLLQQGGMPTFGPPQDQSTLLRMLDEQDRAGIDVQVLSTGPNNPYSRDRVIATAAAREVNDSYAEIVARHGGRFAAFGSLPLPHPEAAAAEAVRCLDHLGLSGLQIGCSALGCSLADPSLRELWAELDRREAIVYVHPGGILMGSEPGLAGMDDALIAVSIGSAAEIAVAALQLMVLRRTYPGLQVVIGLLGGSLPFLAERVAWLGGRWKEPTPTASVARSGSLLEELKALSYDINLLPDTSVISSARTRYGVDRLLFGSDAPGSSPEAAVEFLLAAGLTEDECEAVLVRNPRRLFGGRLPGDLSAKSVDTFSAST